MFFFYNSRDRTWQPLLVSSQPILDFLQPWWAGGSVQVFLKIMFALFFENYVIEAQC